MFPDDAACRSHLILGANSYGQLGLGHKEDVLVPQTLKDVSCKCQDIRSITGGGGHSAVITGAGELFVCGHNKEGQLGLNHTENVLCFTLCAALSGFCVQEVACGWDFTIILGGDGLVLSCGSNAFGQLGVPQISGPCLIPQKIESLKEKVVGIAAGLRHALAATESGLVFQWGTGMASRARRAHQGKSLPLFWTAKEPCEIKGLEDVKAKRVAAGSYHCVSLTGEGHLYVWGSNKHGQLVSKEIFLVEPKKIDTQFFSHEKIGAVWSGWTHLVAQTGLCLLLMQLIEAEAFGLKENGQKKTAGREGQACGEDIKVAAWITSHSSVLKNHLDKSRNTKEDVKCCCACLFLLAHLVED
ncbi:secretion-regulating guanine nucleotide exchange factor isoform X10 [Lagopus muta]|uniref:secretion-regulating guanine nucleotide exchange factor isoform X10 n=1 Tax=Lagopus muta TaxID=64668 RepID=UPI00209D7CF6|nr:secretion-regulating guanine nucleotide exchange factor isoform X10 [Lagopus muta]